MILPNVRKKVEEDRDKRLSQLGKSVACEFVLMMGDNPELFKDPPSTKNWNALGAFFANVAKKQLVALREPDTLDRPLQNLRQAVFFLLGASLSFLAAAGLVFTTYEPVSSLGSIAGAVFFALFFYNVVLIWHDLTR